MGSPNGVGENLNSPECNNVRKDMTEKREIFCSFVLLSALLLVSGCAHGQPKRKTYQNPLLESHDMADPDVLRVGNKYYLYPTWRGWGYDVFVSDDLVNWTHEGLAFKDARGGAWAPDLFHNKRGDGKFYLYYTDTPSTGERTPTNKQIGVAVADSPLGPFVDKGSLERDSIDAHLFEDDDGKLYLYYVKFGPTNHIVVQAMVDPLTKKGKPTDVIAPTEQWERISGPVTEGPFMLKHNGIYYLTYSGTGADSPNYGIGYATSNSPLGPFKKYAGNPIVKRTDKVLGPGHHCVVEGPDGKLWMVYHQKRSEKQSYHRYLALDPMWFDDDGILHARVSFREDEPAP